MSDTTTTKIKKPLPVYQAVVMDPPAATRRGRKTNLGPALEDAKMTPGEWVRVGVYFSKSGATNTISQIRKGRTIPAGAYEFRPVPTDEGSQLFAKFVGDTVQDEA